ncbi:hypothetical protein TB2_045117 [Malus domestica]
MAANANSFMFPWSPSPTHTHTHTHGMFNPRTEFSRNGLCNGVKNEQARPRWRPRGPTVPMVVRAVMMKLKWVFQFGVERLYLGMELGTSGARFALIEMQGTIYVE